MRSKSSNVVQFRSTTSEEEDTPTLEMPDLAQFFAYRPVYALCTVLKTGENKGRLKATHYCCVMLGGGPSPIWGVWNVNGRFVHIDSSKSRIMEKYHDRVWRRKSAQWKIVSVTNDDTSGEREIINRTIKER